jgi:hypothetical protein
MGCKLYCGCATTENKVKWGAFASLLVTAFALMFAASCILAAQDAKCEDEIGPEGESTLTLHLFGNMSAPC